MTTLMKLANDTASEPRPILDENQLNYLADVLGIGSVMMPAAEAVSVAAPASQHVPISNRLLSEIPSGTRQIILGDLGSSALVCLFRSDFPNDFLPQPETELAQKMIEAMKLGAKDILWLEWTGSELAPPGLRDLAHGAGFRPILCFGQMAAHGILQPQQKKYPYWFVDRMGRPARDDHLLASGASIGTYA